MPYFRRSSAITLQRRFHARRIAYLMNQARRGFRRTPLRYRAVRRVPSFYWKYRNRIRLRY